MRYNDASIREIAARLGVPRSTVGGWLRGFGETIYHKDCRFCGDRFIASRRHARRCATCAHRACA